MTDIEDAIQAMENLNMVLSITDSERHAANLAIQALKEKAERIKGCEGCKYFREDRYEDICYLCSRNTEITDMYRKENAE